LVDYKVHGAWEFKWGRVYFTGTYGPPTTNAARSSRFFGQSQEVTAGKGALDPEQNRLEKESMERASMLRFDVL
jgi:hypothetical protein